MRPYLRGFIAFTLVAGLTGCGMLDGLERLTTETRDSVRETHQAHRYGFFHGLLMSEHAPRHARVDAAMKVLVLAPEDQLPGIVGSVARSLDSAAVRVALTGVARELANVSIVGDRDPVLPVIPVSESFFTILEDAAWATLFNLHDAAHTPGKTAEQLNLVRQAYDRMALVGPVIFGAMNVAALRGIADTDEPRAFRVSTARREQLARWIDEIATALRYDRARIEAQRITIRMRLLEGDPTSRLTFSAL